MTIVCWFDALTPKQAKIAAILYIELRKYSIELFITTREYPYIKDVLNFYKVPYVVVGYYGETRRDKLEAYAKRILELLKVLPEFALAIGFPSPEMHRIAFGLGKPIITLTDTPQAYHVSKMTLPLSTVVIVPEVFPDDVLKSYIPEKELHKVVKFRGLFELMWISRILHKVSEGKSILKSLGLEDKEFVIVRPEESKAAYYVFGEKLDILKKLIEHILEEKYRVLILPRYSHQREYLCKVFREHIERADILIPQEMNIDLSLLYPYAKLVITGGLTMATEAALMGVPAITYFPEELGICTYLRKHGFPIEHVANPADLLPKARHMLREEGLSIEEVASKIKVFEDPVNVIVSKLLQLVQ